MSTTNIDLFGYDTAFGISFTKVNEAIKKKGVTPKSFSHTHTSPPSTKHQTIKTLIGEWGDWKINTQSSGKTITLACPIKSGSYTYKRIDTVKQSSEETKCDITGKSVNIELKLEYLNEAKATYTDPTALPQKPGQQLNLAPKLKTDDPTDPIVSVKWIAQDMLNNQSGADLIDDSDAEVEIVKSYFEHWFLENIKDFKHIFAIFIINQEAKNPEYQWLKPKKVSYAVAAKDNDESGSVLGVMAVTDEENKDTTAYPQIDHRILDNSKGSAAYAIQTKSLVKNWILKGLLHTKLGTGESDFKEIENGLGYTNVKQIVWNDFKDEKEKQVTAYIDKENFSVTVVNNEIRMEFLNIHWEHSEGIIVHASYTDYYTLKLKSGIDKSGQAYKNVLTAVPTRTPVFSMNYSVEDWKQKKDLIISISIGVAGAIVGGLIGSGLGAAVEKVIAKGVETAIVRGAEGATANTLTASLEPVLGSALEESGSQILGESSAVINPGVESAINATKPLSFTGKILANKGKFIGGLLGSILGGSLGIIPDMLTNLAQQNFSKVPTLDNFAANCVESVKWPAESNFELIDANLVSGGFILNGNIK
ncbi:TULIP family P47-like protein [Bacillus sp. 2SH]|uniref:TULIP family P47-like protein n=1 Tax=Bacillus sp. 2SH TaxID=2502202 RepID=UPI0010FA363E|nr:TULIP family P47-like protein [Bacillus sp. 2SH]